MYRRKLCSFDYVPYVPDGCSREPPLPPHPLPIEGVANVDYPPHPRLASPQPASKPALQVMVTKFSGIVAAISRVTYRQNAEIVRFNGFRADVTTYVTFLVCV